MIVYENALNDFISQCNKGIIADEVAKKMQVEGIPFGHPEENSWVNSLPFVAKALDDDSIDKNINLAIEYQFSLNKKRIDVIVYGQNEEKEDSLVVIELKQWSTATDSKKPNYVFTNGGGGAQDYLHPSFQAYAYGCTLKGFNSVIQDQHVDVESCSYLHNMDNGYEDILRNPAKYPFVSQSPVFLKDDEDKLRDFIKKYVRYGRKKLIYEIDNGSIRPSKNFSNMLYQALKGQPIFTLDDEQANSVSTIIYEVTSAIEHRRRKTIIIKGGPGSGKSVVAINALGQLIHPQNGEPNNAVYCTTNFTPRTLFSELLVKDDYKKKAIDNLFRTLATFSRSRECEFDCVLMDESHRAFEWKFGQGIKKDVDMAEKVFYSSLVNVFFIDEDQVVTKHDYLTIDLIKKYAEKYNSELIEGEDLHLTSQFRCMGGQNYIDFINCFLGYSSQKVRLRSKNYDFQVFDTPTEMYDKIKNLQIDFPRTRLLAGYTHEWVSNEKNPKCDASKYDFDMDGHRFLMRWNRKVDWSFINDTDQNDRIGCIHTIQGVDMDYAGVIIGKDLIYRDGHIVFDKTQNAKSDTDSGIRTADEALAERMIRNTYKVLLTRAIYGTYVYCEDKALNNYLKTIII
ncbi:MAG: DUF2075 domain-containing protein [Bacilli bacterium]|jgi:DUF2075 family protein|nr:DUF2075 domain-containing protein [Bacilli bacterium]